MGEGIRETLGLYDLMAATPYCSVVPEGYFQIDCYKEEMKT